MLWTRRTLAWAALPTLLLWWEVRQSIPWTTHTTRVVFAGLAFAIVQITIYVRLKKLIPTSAYASALFALALGLAGAMLYAKSAALLFFNAAIAVGYAGLVTSGVRYRQLAAAAGACISIVLSINTEGVVRAASFAVGCAAALLLVRDLQAEHKGALDSSDDAPR